MDLKGFEKLIVDLAGINFNDFAIVCLLILYNYDEFGFDR